MNIKDLLYVLYQTNQSYDTLHLTWQYKFVWGGMQILNKRYADRRPLGSFTYSNYNADKDWFRENYELWFSPSVWRLDTIGETRHKHLIQVTQSNTSWVYNKKQNEIITNDSVRKMPRGKFKHRYVDGGLGQRIEHLQLLNPSFLMMTHSFEIVERDTSLGRNIFVVDAKYKQNGEMLFDSVFWTTADNYHLWVDAEKGILLRYSAIVDKEEIATVEVTDVAFDQGISPETFDVEHILKN